MKSQPPAADGLTASPNRRRAILYGTAAVVSLIGVADSVYLTLEHTAGRSVRCTIVQGCSTVLSSAYASYGGIPLALGGTDGHRGRDISGDRRIRSGDCKQCGDTE